MTNSSGVLKPTQWGTPSSSALQKSIHSGTGSSLPHKVRCPVAGRTSLNQLSLGHSQMSQLPRRHSSGPIPAHPADPASVAATGQQGPLSTGPEQGAPGAPEVGDCPSSCSPPPSTHTYGDVGWRGTHPYYNVPELKMGPLHRTSPMLVSLPVRAPYAGVLFPALQRAQHSVERGWCVDD